MTISKDLFLAILSMDSYNRGYHERIAGLGGVNSQIGNAFISSQSDTLGNTEGVGAGFYGLSYNTSGVTGFSAGEKTIAYRGTDAAFGSGEIGSDIWNAYGVGAGSPNGKQAELAIKFYKSLAGANLQSANISLTGHSSGGGLAGLVGGLYGKGGTLFDNMAFEAAAFSARNQSDTSPENEFYNDALKTLIYGSSDPWNVNFSGLRTNRSTLIHRFRWGPSFKGIPYRCWLFWSLRPNSLDRPLAGRVQQNTLPRLFSTTASVICLSRAVSSDRAPTR
jgi:hypothetical protein